MKKIIVSLTTVLTALLLFAFSIGSTTAYFTDKDTEAGAVVSAGRLEVSVDLALADYGIPGDTLLTSVGNNAAPDKSTVSVINKGGIDMDYTLSLTVNKETSHLLDRNGIELRNVNDEPLQFIYKLTNDAENVTYVYESESALEKGKSDVFGLALKFKGATLSDGNDYQNKPISVVPTVIAVQMGGDE